jgi:hypothetical protein
LVGGAAQALLLANRLKLIARPIRAKSIRNPL